MGDVAPCGDGVVASRSVPQQCAMCLSVCSATCVGRALLAHTAGAGGSVRFGKPRTLIVCVCVSAGVRIRRPMSVWQCIARLGSLCSSGPARFGLCLSTSVEPPIGRSSPQPCWLKGSSRRTPPRQRFSRHRQERRRGRSLALCERCVAEPWLRSFAARASRRWQRRRRRGALCDAQRCGCGASRSWAAQVLGSVRARRGGWRQLKIERNGGRKTRLCISEDTEDRPLRDFARERSTKRLAVAVEQPLQAGVPQQEGRGRLHRVSADRAGHRPARQRLRHQVGVLRQLLAVVMLQEYRASPTVFAA